MHQVAPERKWIVPSELLLKLETRPLPSSPSAPPQSRLKPCHSAVDRTPPFNREAQRRGRGTGWEVELRRAVEVA